MPGLREDLQIVLQQECYMLYVRYVHLTKGQAYSQETDPLVKEDVK
jgi:hypothetical protein